MRKMWASGAGGGLLIVVLAFPANARGIVPLKACGSFSQSNTTYVLQNNVSSPDTCFPVTASGVTLNLNGHTITFGTQPSKAGKARYGVSAISCWDFTLNPGGLAEGAACGDDSANLAVIGPGNITQGANAGPYSHCIRIGQQAGSGSLTVRKVSFSFSSPGSAGVWTTFSSGSMTLSGNTYNNGVKFVGSRSQIDGTSIGFYASGGGSAASVSGETIRGGPQGAILIEAPGSTVHDNEISQGNPAGTRDCPNPGAGCQFTNDFAIYAWANHSSIYNNTIHSLEGRGIQLAGGTGTGGSAKHEDGSGASDVSVHDNDIIAIEHANNPEYNGCELDGAFGIEFKDTPSNVRVEHNRVEADASDCMGGALRLLDTGSAGPGRNSSARNIFVGKAIEGFKGPDFQYEATGLSLEEVRGGFTSTNDAFIGDTASVWVDWDGITGNKPVVLI
jgi:hypothetical protein